MHIAHETFCLTSAMIGSDMTGLGRPGDAGLGVSGPWNHPLMESRVLLADSTSDTWNWYIYMHQHVLLTLILHPCHMYCEEKDLELIYYYNLLQTL